MNLEPVVKIEKLNVIYNEGKSNDCVESVPNSNEGALQKIDGVQLCQARNSSKGILRYLETLWKLISISWADGGGDPNSDLALFTN